MVYKIFIDFGYASASEYNAYTNKKALNKAIKYLKTQYDNERISIFISANN